MTPRAAPALTARIGLVAIGRNEGERLRACLTAVKACLDAGLIDRAKNLARIIEYKRAGGQSS